MFESFDDTFSAEVEHGVGVAEDVFLVVFVEDGVAVVPCCFKRT